jgi:secretory lipase
MVAGDVRTLARDFCASGTAVDHTQYDTLSHITTFPVWTSAALAWLDGRFAGKPGSERLLPDPARQLPGPREACGLAD